MNKIKLIPKTTEGFELLIGYNNIGKIVRTTAPTSRGQSFVIELDSIESGSMKMIVYVNTKEDRDFEYKVEDINGEFV